MSIEKTRRSLQLVLRDFRDGGAPADVVVDYIEGLISAKVEEILQAKKDNARAGVGKRESRDG